MNNKRLKCDFVELVGLRCGINIFGLSLNVYGLEGVEPLGYGP